MTGARRGFGRERHTALKAVLAAVAVAGFLAAWAGLARAHPASSESGSPAESSPPPDVTSSAGTMQPTLSSSPTALPGASVTPVEALTAAAVAQPDPGAAHARTPKRTRGS